MNCTLVLRTTSMVWLNLLPLRCLVRITCWEQPLHGGSSNLGHGPKLCQRECSQGTSKQDHNVVSNSLALFNSLVNMQSKTPLAEERCVN